MKVYKVQMHHEVLGWRDVPFAESKTRAYCDGYVDCMDSHYPSKPVRIICKFLSGASVHAGAFFS